MNFASLCFASKQKLSNRSEAKNFKRKDAKNSEKSEKNRKNRLEFRFASFHFEAKITQLKRNEKFEGKISEKKQKKRSEIFIVK